MEINKLFAVNARDSALRMEEMTQDMHKVAEKTARQTASMHIITLVTLVFLPGTFVAVRTGLPYLRKYVTALTGDQTFFGSGLFQWDDDNPLEMPMWKPQFFALFAKICFPMMAGTILIWFAAYWWAKRLGREEQKEHGLEERQQQALATGAAPDPTADNRGLWSWWVFGQRGWLNPLQCRPLTCLARDLR
jgi:hypothetical protein